MNIKKAEKDDLSKILALQKLCYTENGKRYNDFNISPLTQTIEELEKEAEYSTILKVTKGSEIIGSIRAYKKDNTCFIGKIIVHPHHQNNGIGRKLINEVETIFKDTERFELFTGFLDEKNIYLYEKLGYKQFKQVKLSEDFTMIHLEK